MVRIFLMRCSVDRREMRVGEVVSERSWLVPSGILTVALGATALLAMPNHSGVMPALLMLPLWMFAGIALAATYGYFRMMASGVKSPFAHISHAVRHDWRELLLVPGGLAVAGLNMIAFMWAKPLLNQFVPFWADPLLARVDRALFLGYDPWTLLGWLNSMPMAIFYHRGWFALMIVTLVVVLSRPSSPQKSAVMLSYFLLWTLVGPVVHMLLPAAGPVFFERLGYGSDFAGIRLPDEMIRMTDYLWTHYSGDRFGPGSGISAMPSLHIATTAWMVIAMQVHARSWAVPMALVGSLIFLLSISLGWHYAVDGIVGAAAAIGCYKFSERMIEDRLKLRQPALAAPQPALD